MARIRSIKPEFWTSAQILECSPNARLLFIGLWNFCDDAGRHPASPKQVKASVFPSDDIPLNNIRGMLDELSVNGLIAYYSVDNIKYFYVTGWKNQRIDKPQPAKYPDPFAEHSESIPRTFPPDRIGKDRIGEDKKRKKESSLRSDSNGSFNQYFFESGVIHLKKEDFQKWKEAYPYIDLRAELTAIGPGEWASSLGSKWFAPVSALLNKRNREEKRKRDSVGSRTDPFHAPLKDFMA